MFVLKMILHINASVSTSDENFLSKLIPEVTNVSNRDRKWELLTNGIDW